MIKGENKRQVGYLVSMDASSRTVVLFQRRGMLDYVTTPVPLQKMICFLLTLYYNYVLYIHTLGVFRSLLGFKDLLFLLRLDAKPAF